MKKINLAELCWMLLMGALIVIIGKLMLFDELRFYLHPKMNKFVIFAEIILILLFLYQTSRVFRPGNAKFKWGFFLFLIPIWMLLMAGDASGVIFKNRTINISGYDLQPKSDGRGADSLNKEIASPAYDLLPPEDLDNPDANAVDPTNPVGSLPTVGHDGTVIPQLKEGDLFLDTLFGIEGEEGKEVVLEGFVYRDEFLEKDEFFVSRMIINCCVAEATLIGIVAKGENGEAFAPDTWVKVIGKTKNMPITKPYTNEKKSTLVLEIDSIEKIEAYDSPYVYF